MDSYIFPKFLSIFKRETKNFGHIARWKKWGLDRLLLIFGQDGYPSWLPGYVPRLHCLDRSPSHKYPGSLFSNCGPLNSECVNLSAGGQAWRGKKRDEVSEGSCDFHGSWFWQDGDVQQHILQKVVLYYRLISNILKRQKSRYHMDFSALAGWMPSMPSWESETSQRSEAS